MNEHKHVINRSMLEALKKLYQLAGMENANIKNLKLTRNQWDNFQKLRYWGFVAKKEGTIKSGQWRVTPSGYSFMIGKNSTYKWAWTYRGETVRLEGDTITIFSLFPESYRKHEDYSKDSKAAERTE